MPNPRLPGNGADERETTGVVVERAQVPAVEAEVPVARPEADRVRRLLPLQRGHVEAGSIPVAREHVRVHGHRRGGVEAAREQHTVWEGGALLTICLDPETLKGSREVQVDHRSLDHPGDEMLMLRARHDRHLPGEVALAVVLEGTPRELRLVRLLDERKDDVLERAAVVGHHDLREADRQADATEQVRDLLVATDLRHGLKRETRELVSRREAHGGRCHALQSVETRRVAVLRLDEPELTVGVEHLARGSLDGDPPTVSVDQLDRRVLEPNAVFTTEIAGEHLLVTACIRMQLLPVGLLLSSLETTPPLRSTITLRTHGTFSLGLSCSPKKVFTPARGPGPPSKLRKALAVPHIDNANAFLKKERSKI
jgi:hypothetical protein